MEATLTTSWNENRIATLKEMWTAGYSSLQIAEKLGGVTRSAVIGKASRLGLGKHKTAPKHVVRHAKPAAPPSPPPTDAPGISLLELTTTTCRFPQGHPGEPDFSFCGADTVQGAAYCCHHAARAYTTYTRPAAERISFPDQRGPASNTVFDRR